MVQSIHNMNTAPGQYTALNLKFVLERINNISTRGPVHLTELNHDRSDVGWKITHVSFCPKETHTVHTEYFPSPFTKQSYNLTKWNECEGGGMVNRLWKGFIS